MKEFGGIKMDAVKGKEGHLGGNKAAERPGAGQSHVDHHKVDGIDHAKHHGKVKKVMKDHGYHNVSYHGAGMK